MDLSIIVVNWNTRKIIEQCLTSALAAVNGLQVEIFVIDNASTDDSPKMLRSNFPHVHLIENQQNVGFARANNQGLRLATGRYSLLLNSDAFLALDSLTTLVRFADDHPEAGVFGGMLRNADGGFQASYNDFPGVVTEWLAAAGLAGRLIRPQFPSHAEADSLGTREVDWIPGALLMARTSMLRQIGYLDEDYFMYTEETDLCWRARRAGWRVMYCPDVQVIHLGGGSASRRTQTQVKLLYGSKALFFRKHRGQVTMQVYRAGVRLISLFKIGGWYALSFAKRGDNQALLQDKIRAHQVLINGRW